MRPISLLVSALVASGCAQSAAAELDLLAVRDNTIYAPNSEAHSNGGGPTLGAGSNGLAEPRRGLVSFDLSAIPREAEITSATLRLTLARAAASDMDRVLSLHRLLASWGENPDSDAGTGAGSGFGVPALPGDATWLTRFYDQGPKWAVTLWRRPVRQRRSRPN